jgi:hypothetical protein
LLQDISAVDLVVHPNRRPGSALAARYSARFTSRTSFGPEVRMSVPV